MKYTLFVDESGQSGIKRIRTSTSGGASRYMTLGAVLVPNTKRDSLADRFARLACDFGKPELHCSKLNHSQIVRFCRELAAHQVLLFGVISLKETLGSYKSDIRGSDKQYYNKCSQYLLERVGLFMKRNGISENQLSVCFEEGNFDYSGLRGLIGACRNKPLHPASKNLEFVNPNSISSEPKKKEPLLQASDLVAHALFKCVDDAPSTYGVVETKYINELRKKFFFDKATKKVCGFGIYPVHNLKSIKANTDVADFLGNLSIE